MDDPFEGWEQGPPNPCLGGDEVHVWGWSLAGGVDDLARVHALLSADELARMRTFRFAPDAERYARARAGLRRVLGRYVGLRPEEARFVYGGYGKPDLASGQGGAHFNLSHTQRIAVAALSIAGPVGIDVEQRRPVSRALGNQVFSSGELRVLNGLRDEQYTDAFFNGWTRKEAVCKAEGLGFSLPAQAFSVGLTPGQPARIEDAGGVLSRAWSLTELPIGGTVTGCVAVAVPSILRLYRLAAAEAGSHRA